MKFFNSCTRFIFLVGLVIGATNAIAAERWIASSSGGDKFESLTQDLMYLFPTSDDHRLIKKDAVELKKVAKSWKWRFEPYKDRAALRVNGKIQATFKVTDNENNIYEVNGQPIQISTGLSYLSFKSQMKKIISRHQVSLDQMFFERANAIAPFFGLALFGAGGLAANHQQSKKPQSQCIREWCSQKEYRNLLPRHFKTRGAASSYGTVTSYSSNNYCYQRIQKIGRKWPDFVKKNPQNPLAACVEKKSRNNGSEWGFKDKVALDHCAAVQKCLYTAVPAYQQPAPSYTPFQPICTKDKYGNYGPGCEQAKPVTYTPFQPICTKDKYGNYGPGCNQQPAPAPTPFQVPYTGVDKSGYEPPVYESPGNAESPQGGRD